MLAMMKGDVYFLMMMMMIMMNKFSLYLFI